MTDIVVDILPSQPQFYCDMGKPDVERLARAICAEYGVDPDRKVPETGYANAALIPVWWKYQDEALQFIAMSRALRG